MYLNLTTKKKILLSFAFIFLSASAILATYYLYKTSLDPRNKASEQAEPRWTLADIDGKELSGQELDTLLKREKGYVEDVRVYKEVQSMMESGKPLSEYNSGTLQVFEERFGIDAEEIKKEGEKLDDFSYDQKSNKSLIQRVEAASEGVQTPEVGSRPLPSIEGFNVDTFTGVASISYPIEIPAVRGNIPFSIGLSYSSRTIDDMRANLPSYDTARSTNNGADIDSMRCKKWVSPGQGNACHDPNHKDDCNVSWAPCKVFWDDEVQVDKVGIVGLGWDLTSTPSIYVDPDNEHEYMLSVGGSNVRIKYDSENDKFFTFPESRFQIERLSGGRWKVVDLSGTTYVFGSDDEAGDGLGLQKDKIKNSAVNYSFKAARSSDGTGQYYCWSAQTSWSLTKVSDVVGNTLEIEYEQTVDSQDVSNGTSCAYTVQKRPLLVKYNYDEEQGRYMTKIRYEYTQEQLGEGRSINDGKEKDDKTKEREESMRNRNLLQKIVMKNDDILVGSYTFKYRKTFPNSNWTNADGYMLLTSIEKKGFKEQGSMKPYTFCYNSLTSSSRTQICDDTDTSQEILQNDSEKEAYKAGNIYLTKANNGYGGEVTYFYKFVPKIDEVCVNKADDAIGEENKKYIRGCSTDTQNWDGTDLRDYSKLSYTSYYVVSKVVANNDSTGALGEYGKTKVTQYEYVGNSQGYGSGYGVKDNYDRSKVFGLQFIGYPVVRTKVYEPASQNNLDSVKSFLSYTEQKTFRSVRKGDFQTQYKPKDIASCFMIDPRKGRVYESRILSQDGSRVLGVTKTDYLITKKENGEYKIISSSELSNYCSPSSKDWAGFDVFAKSNYSSIDGKESKSETIYDFELDKRTDRSFGNVVKTHEFGNLQDSRDDVYSYTRYLSPTDFGCADGSAPSSCEGLKAYYDKNLTSLVAATAVSNVDVAKITDIPQDKKYNWTRTFYDEGVSSWGYQQGVSGVKGLPSTTRQIYLGANADDLVSIDGGVRDGATRRVVNAKVEYNKYGQVVKSYSPVEKNSGRKPTQSVTYFDTTYHMYPVCTLNAMKSSIDLDPNADWTKVCNSSSDIYAQSYHYGKDGVDWSEGLARGLVYLIRDENGAQSEFEYDEYGRAVWMKGPDPDTPYKTLSKPSMEAEYYDSEVPMKTRIKTWSVTVDKNSNKKDIYKVSDQIVDGFGNEVQSVAYDLHYDGNDGNKKTFAMLNTTIFNGVGQVTKLYEGVKLDGYSMPTKPEIIALNRINSGALSSAAVTETRYDYLNRPIELKKSVGGLKSIETSQYQGYVTRSINGRGTTTEIQVDSFGRTVRSTSYVCSSNSQVCNASNGRAVNTRFTYHPVLGSVTRVIDNNGVIVSKTAYNTAGMVLLTSDLDRGLIKNYYDDLGRLQKVVNGRGVVVETSFDEAGRPIMVKASKGGNSRVEELKYDENMLGKLSSRRIKDSLVSNSWLQEMSMKYNIAGSTTETLNRVLDLTDDSVVSGNGEKYVEVRKNPEYTETGTVVSNKTSVKNGYFEGGNEYTVDNVAYGYDEDGRLIRSYDRNTNKNYVEDIKYNFRNQPITIQMGNNVEENYEYDALSRLTNKVVKMPGSRQYSNVAYRYETRNGNSTNLINLIYSNIDSTQRNSFSYDSLGRLEGTRDNQQLNTEYNARYEFDNLGNLTKKIEEAKNVNVKSNADTSYIADFYKIGNNVSSDPCNVSDYRNAGYNSNYGCPYHAPYRSKVNGQLKYFLYDKGGNLVEERTANGNKIREFKYNILDLPVEVVGSNDDPSEVVARYYYGLDGQRLGKIVFNGEAPPIYNNGAGDDNDNDNNNNEDNNDGEGNEDDSGDANTQTSPTTTPPEVKYTFTINAKTERASTSKYAKIYVLANGTDRQFVVNGKVYDKSKPYEIKNMDFSNIEIGLADIAGPSTIEVRYIDYYNPQPNGKAEDVNLIIKSVKFGDEIFLDKPTTIFPNEMFVEGNWKASQCRQGEYISNATTDDVLGGGGIRVSCNGGVRFKVNK